MDLTMYHGKLAQWTVLLTNPDGTPYDPAGHALAFTAKYSPTDVAAIITETTANGNITLSAVTPYPVTISVPPADTASLPDAPMVLLYELDEDAGTSMAPAPLLSGRLAILPTLD